MYVNSPGGSVTAGSVCLYSLVHFRYSFYNNVELKIFKDYAHIGYLLISVLS